MSETLTFPIGPVDPNGGTSFSHETILADTIDILKIKIEPDTEFGTSEVFLYRKSTGQLTDLAYRTRAWPNSIPLIDKLEDNQGVTSERGPATVTRYVDEDSTNKLHIKIRNNHTVAVNYYCTIVYDLVASGITPSTSCTGGNPSGASGLTVLTRNDDPSIPYDSVVLEWNRDTANFDSIFAIMAVISSALPAEGPYQTERTGAGVGFILETGTCTITAGSTAVVVTRASDVAVLGGVLLIYTSDADLDGNVVSAQAINSLTVDTPFHKSGTFTYTIVLPWWVLSNPVITKNKQVIPIPVSAVEGATKEFGLDPLSTKWRTPPLQIPKGTFYATLYSRNLCGVGTRLTSSQFTFTPIVTVLDPQVFADFNDRLLWLPVYSGLPGVASTVSMTFNADGTVSFDTLGNGVFEAGSGMRVLRGVRSRFRLMHDSNSDIKYRVKFVDVTFPTAVTEGGVLAGLLTMLVKDSNNNFVGAIAGAQNGTSTLQIGKSNTTNISGGSTTAASPADTAVVRPTEPISSVELRVTIKSNGGSVVLYEIEYSFSGGAFVSVGTSADQYPDLEGALGTEIFLGFTRGRISGNVTAKLTEFELISGVGAL